MNEAKKLYRSKNDRIFLGVCGGLAQYFNIDPLIVRLFFVFITLIHGVGIVIYLVMALVVPTEDTAAPAQTISSNDTKVAQEDVESPIQQMNGQVDEKAGRNRARDIFGVAIVILGLFLLMNETMPFIFRWINWSLIFSVLIILFGTYLLTRKN